MDMLKNVLQQQQAQAGGPKLPGGADMAGHAQRIWSMLDNMAESDPEAYKKFIEDQAKLYKEDKDAAGPKQRGPVLLLQVAKRSGAAAVRVVISLWDDTTGKIPKASCADGAAITASTSEWKDVDIRFTSRQPPFTTKKGDSTPWEVVELHCHPMVLELAAAGTPPALRAVLAEATVRHVEHLLKAPLDRRTLTLQVARAALTEEEVKAIEERMTGKAVQRAAKETLGDAATPSLLAQLSQLTTSSTSTSRASPQPKPQQAPRKPLIQEL